MRQVIIARKDLNMSAGKLAAQVSHASMAFLTNHIRDCYCNRGIESCHIEIHLDKRIYDEWICGIFTKTVCEARNYNQLMKAVSIAQELGLSEGTDYFLIKDACLTELEPEEVDENGVGRTLIIMAAVSVTRSSATMLAELLKGKETKTDALLENVLAIRLVPLFIKDIFLKYFHKISYYQSFGEFFIIIEHIVFLVNGDFVN